MYTTTTRLTLSVLALLFGTLVLSLLVAPVTSVWAAPRPNIVVIMTDDQTLESMRVMPKTRGHLGGAKGATFSNFFVSQSLCCPSRATFLTGQYTHNHGVMSNKPPDGGYTKLDHSNTLAVWLQEAGYHTVHLGKYLNGYGLAPRQTEVPPGWSDWQGLIHPPTAMYNYTINDNGTLVRYGSAPNHHQTDVLANRAAAVIRERAGTSQPFFLYITPTAPHAETITLPAGSPNPRPAPRHAGRFAFEPLPRPPSFNEADVSDKPWNIRVNLPLLSPTQINAITTRYRDRLTALLAVDDLVEQVVATLSATGQLANTVVFFTSDNGFHHGEHRIPEEKHRIYEEDIRVPLFVRGGGFPAGVTATQQVANIDLAPTIVALTGATPGQVMDGRSLLPLALNPSRGQSRDLLIMTTYNWAIRTQRYLYGEYLNGQMELYDLQSDPYQLTSRHNDPTYAPIKAQLQTKLDRLLDCAGTGCSQGSN